MSKRIPVAAFLAVATVLAAAPAAPAAGATDAKAFFREGQTFLTWKEDPAVEGERYCVYAADKPISADNLAAAKLLAKIPEGSNHFQFLRNLKVQGNRFFEGLVKEKWYQAIQITDDENAAKQLPDGTGLFVRTIHAPASTFYAVVAEKDGKPLGGPAALAAPVAEKVETPGAVLLQKLDDRYYAYAFFCDYDLWNPDGVEDNWEGYAHVLHIRAPAADHKTAREPYPVSFRLHAYSAWGDWNIGYCWPSSHVNVKLLDYHLTWWYGYSDQLPRQMERTNVPPPGQVVNFTERRVLQVAAWLAKGPANFPFKVDPAQFCLLGGSMGGTGAHTIGTRNGDVFAGAFADEGICDWSLPANLNPWANGVSHLWGPQSRNDPTNEGPGVYDLLNLPRQVAAHPEKELPFMNIGQGIIDYVIPFDSFVRYMKALEAGKHPYASAWEMAGHSPWVGSGSPMDYILIRRDEVIPAFANASCNTPLASAMRIMGTALSIDAKSLTIKAGSLSGQNANVDGGFPDLAGKTLVLGPSGANRDTFRIASSTPTTLTIAEGSLAEYLPPVTGWDIYLLKQDIAKKEGKPREPTDAEKRVVSEQHKKTFLVCDGQPRGNWNGYFAWSTRLQNFDAKSTEDDIVDTPRRLALCIRLARNGHTGEWTADTATADATPRRCRQFAPAPGESVHWENWDCTDPAAPRKLAEGEAKADANGLVTVEQFVIGRKGWGNRLVLTRK